ncbi:hypothetical protein H310_05410 [Aphanomyces invadans]|uniref:SGNH hydrolase-type esterase domain-containing protein n=1 Tax=Aphanomyces invadans TaxID=157072 RepID=A0A024U9N0_9STRA|nr:hypothetical protein H310_05410 [Aphanomyces invadans]ETW02969.1 hypothetical protein H310_05410 [Aphanomyces invadans]RHY29705.1 hypothetical protein DYB32_004925 [Aphanomyces invadans]|eukprot:XP_008868353.1 hypothetical protein H310_05410 [Aphanomyces invadans]
MGYIGYRSTPLIVALGDSITQFGADPAIQGFQALLSQDYVRKADVLNRGLSGWTTRWWVQYLPQLIRECGDNAPVLVIIALGANDASLASGESHIRHVPLDEYQSNLRVIVNGLRAAFPLCQYLFLTPPAVDNSKWNPADKLNAVTQAYAKACVQVAVALNIPVIDTWQATQGRWELFRDGVHPNTQGNVLFHQLIQSSIAASYPHLTPQTLPLNYPDTPPS